MTEHAINELAEGIRRDFNPERIVLFGSYAYGTLGDDSDVDILVIMPYERTPLAQAVAIAQKYRTPFAVDIIVRSHEELQQRIAWNDRFITEILARGRVLYAADHI